jgi:hypothetical protein
MVFDMTHLPPGPAGTPGTTIVGFNAEQAPFTLNPSSEVNYTIGIERVESARITLAADLIGRVVRNSAHLVLLDNTGQIPTQFQPVRNFFFESSTLSLAIGVVGAKVKVAERWVLSGSVLFPLTSSGATPGVTPVVGLERAF